MNGRDGRTVLVIDDEAGVRFGIREYLEGEDWRVEEAGSISAGLRACQALQPDVVVLDFALPDGNGLEALRRIRAKDPALPVVMLTGHGSIELAVDAIKTGAEQFFTKPVQMGPLAALLGRLVEARRALRREEAERRIHPGIDPFHGGALAEQRPFAERLAQAGSPLLILGETGTGKGVLARWIHANGPRAREAFVDLNCAGLNREFLESELFGHERGAFTGAHQRKPGLVELAHRGTLFLDEIGDLDPAVQAKLLKVVEEKRFRRLGDVRDQQVDVRIVAATHQQLERLVREGRFRQDLYFRLSTHVLRLPSLRERSGDLPTLVEDLVASISRDLGRAAPAVPESTLAALRAHPWSGNIRELRNTLERALMHNPAEVLELCDRCLDALPAPEPCALLREQCDAHILEVLEQHGGNHSAAARALGISRSTLYVRLRRAGDAIRARARRRP